MEYFCAQRAIFDTHVDRGDMYIIIQHKKASRNLRIKYAIKRVSLLDQRNDVAIFIAIFSFFHKHLEQRHIQKDEKEKGRYEEKYKIKN